MDTRGIVGQLFAELSLANAPTALDLIASYIEPQLPEPPLPAPPPPATGLAQPAAASLSSSFGSLSSAPAPASHSLAASSFSFGGFNVSSLSLSASDYLHPLKMRRTGAGRLGRTSSRSPEATLSGALGSGSFGTQASAGSQFLTVPTATPFQFVPYPLQPEASSAHLPASTVTTGSLSSPTPKPLSPPLSAPASDLSVLAATVTAGRPSVVATKPSLAPRQTIPQPPPSGLSLTAGDPASPGESKGSPRAKPGTAPHLSAEQFAAFVAKLPQGAKLGDKEPDEKAEATVTDFSFSPHPAPPVSTAEVLRKFKPQLAATNQLRAQTLLLQDHFRPRKNDQLFDRSARPYADLFAERFDLSSVLADLRQKFLAANLDPSLLTEIAQFCEAVRKSISPPAGAGLAEGEQLRLSEEQLKVLLRDLIQKIITFCDKVDSQYLGEAGVKRMVEAPKEEFITLDAALYKLHFDFCIKAITAICFKDYEVLTRLGIEYASSLQPIHSGKNLQLTSKQLKESLAAKLDYLEPHQLELGAKFFRDTLLEAQAVNSATLIDYILNIQPALEEKSEARAPAKMSPGSSSSPHPAARLSAATSSGSDLRSKSSATSPLPAPSKKEEKEREVKVKPSGYGLQQHHLHAASGGAGGLGGSSPTPVSKPALPPGASPDGALADPVATSTTRDPQGGAGTAAPAAAVTSREGEAARPFRLS